MPKAKWWFIAAGIVAFLQLIPLLGIFVMLLAGPYWFAFFVNAGFAKLAFDALSGPISRVWLAAPILWFGGYYLVVVVSELTVQSERKAIFASNSGQILPFNGKTDALVLENVSGAESADSFVRFYDLDVAYGDGRSVRMAPTEACQTLSSNVAAMGAGISRYGHSEGGLDNRTYPPLCVVSGPSVPLGSIVKIDATRKEDTKGFVKFSYYNITIERTDKRKVVIQSASAEKLKWLPMPAVGCGIGGWWLSGHCHVAFLRDRFIDITPEGRGASGAIASALGLRFAPASTRIEAIRAATSTVSTDDIIKHKTAENLKRLVEVMANPNETFNYHDVSAIATQPRTLVPYAAAITATIESRMKKDVVDAETVRTLQRLTAALPRAEFASEGPRVMQIMSERADLNSNMVFADFQVRVADLGADAAPFLRRLAFSNGRVVSTAAVQGLCRIGMPGVGSDISEILTTELRRKRHESYSERREAAYVALLRFGRADLADTDADTANVYKKPLYEGWRHTITPQSDQSVCSAAYIR